MRRGLRRGLRQSNSGENHSEHEVTLDKSDGLGLVLVDNDDSGSDSQCDHKQRCETAVAYFSLLADGRPSPAQVITYFFRSFADTSDSKLSLFPPLPFSA